MTLKSVIISILFSLIVANVFVIGKEECGHTTKSRVVGGKHVSDNEFPFMVSLQYINAKKISQHFCGGALISNRYILTAAHCIEAIANAKGTPSDLVMVIGTIKNDVDFFDESLQDKKYRYDVDQWIIHKCYNTKDDMNDDIALLRLSKEIQTNNINIGTICLPPKDVEPISTNMTIAGWGVWSETETGEEEVLPHHIQKGVTELVSEEFCKIYNYFRNLGHQSINDRLGTRLCLKHENLTACRGDSGGPAFQLVNGRMYHLGIASFISVGPSLKNFFKFPPNSVIWPYNPIITNRCLKSIPNFYTKTSHYIDWIYEMMDKYKRRNESMIEDGPC